MITAINLRSHLTTILSDSIGTYTFKSGSVSPAIAVIPDSKYGYGYPPTNTTVTGIEVVIIRPSPTTVMLLGGFKSRLSWQIYLKQWDKTKHLEQATNALITGLDKLGYAFESPVRVIPNEKSGGIESVGLVVYEFSHS